MIEPHAATFGFALGVKRAPARMLAILHAADGEIVHAEHLRETLGVTSSTLLAAAHDLYSTLGRQALSFDRQARGYTLTPEARQACAEIIADTPPPQARPKPERRPRKPPADSFWTDARFEHLKRALAEGKGATAIAHELRCSRNAVVGKCNRHGLSRVKPPSKPKVPKMPSQNTAPRRPIIMGHGAVAMSPIPRPPRVRVAEVVESAGRVALLDLGAHMCRWPIGDPQAPDFGFCGARQKPGHPYCADHAKRAVDKTSRLAKPNTRELVRALRRHTH